MILSSPFSAETQTISEASSEVLPQHPMRFRLLQGSIYALLGLLCGADRLTLIHAKICLDEMIIIIPNTYYNTVTGQHGVIFPLFWFDLLFRTKTAFPVPFQALANHHPPRKEVRLRDVAYTVLDLAVSRSCAPKSSCIAPTIECVGDVSLRSHHVSAMGSNCYGGHQCVNFGKLAAFQSLVIASEV